MSCSCPVDMISLVVALVSPGYERDAAVAAFNILRSLTAWTEERSQSNLDRSLLPRASSGQLIGTALYGAVRRVVWDRGANHSPGPDQAYWSIHSYVLPMHHNLGVMRGRKRSNIPREKVHF